LGLPPEILEKYSQYDRRPVVDLTQISGVGELMTLGRLRKKAPPRPENRRICKKSLV
jgi:hypothetical protein